jgi:hypothetical protein
MKKSVLTLTCKLVKTNVASRVSDPHHFNADPDPAFHFNAILIQLFTLKGTYPDRILLLIRWCEPVTTGLQALQDSTVSVHGPLWLHFKPPKLPIFDFNADPDPALYSNADPDPALYSNADPDPASEGSGSAALVASIGYLSAVFRFRIRCLFDPSIRDPGWKKNPDPG